MIRDIVHIDDLCCRCGYFANNQPETHNEHNYGCDHPDNTDGDKQCFASACPLGCLAEADHFIEIKGFSEEEAIEIANGDEYVVIDIKN